jgi:hypothetical protein
MSALKALNLVAVPKHAANDPKQARRNKLLAQLEQQRELARDENYVVRRQRWAKQADGSKQLVEHAKRVKRWWRMDGSGSIYMVVRYGNKLLELDKGKAAIAVGAKDNLVTVLDAVITAVRDGTLDAAIEAVSKSGRPIKRVAA